VRNSRRPEPNTTLRGGGNRPVPRGCDAGRATVASSGLAMELRGAGQLCWHSRTSRHCLAHRWPGRSRTGPVTIGAGNANGGGAAKLKAESRPHRGPGQRRRGSASQTPTTGSRRSLAGAASQVHPEPVEGAQKAPHGELVEPRRSQRLPRTPARPRGRTPPRAPHDPLPRSGGGGPAKLVEGAARGTGSPSLILSLSKDGGGGDRRLRKDVSVESCRCHPSES
jgi:hypothetical protein